MFVVQLVKTIFPKKEPIIPLTLPDMERAQRHMEALAKMEEERRYSKQTREKSEVKRKKEINVISRLMFVAMTRAKRALFLMHGKQDRASIFVYPSLISPFLLSPSLHLRSRKKLKNKL